MDALDLRNSIAKIAQGNVSSDILFFWTVLKLLTCYNEDYPNISVSVEKNIKVHVIMENLISHQEGV